MESENILAVNVPNTVSIVVMALVGMFLLGLIGKLVKSRMPNASVPSGAPAFGM